MARRRFSLLRSIWKLLVLVLFLAGWALAAAAMHVVLVPDPEGRFETRVILLPKDRLGIQDTFVDTRDWTPDDADEHQPLLTRLEEAGHGEYLEHVRPEEPPARQRRR